MIKLGKESGALAISQRMMRGEDGGYYIPNVDAEGNLTWIASNADMELPEAANIRGPIGETGAKGDNGVYVGEEAPTNPEARIWIQPTADDVDEIATKEYVDAAVANVSVDLSDYYTKSEVDNAIANNEVDLSDYYKKSEVDALIPSTSGFITMEDVDELGYTTEEEVNTLINAALGVIENGTY